MSREAEGGGDGRKAKDDEEEQALRAGIFAALPDVRLLPSTSTLHFSPL